MKYISDIADFDTKAIKFDDVVASAKALIDKKTPTKTEAMWGDIIAIGEADDQLKTPATEIEALHYEDRRQFFKTFTEKLSTVKELRVAIKKAKTDGNETTDW